MAPRAPSAPAPTGTPVQLPRLTTRIEGLDQVTRYFLAAPGRISTGIYGPAIKKIGTRLRADVRRFTPVRSGELRASMSIQQGGGKVPRYVSVYTTKAYAWKIETGRDRIGRIARKIGGAWMFRRGTERSLHFMARTVTEVVRAIEKRATRDMKSRGRGWTSSSS